MRKVEPKVFLIAATGLDHDNVKEFLREISAEEFTTDGTTGTEVLCEIAGRLCYKSFKIGLNANVTRVREGNLNYLQNSVISQKHGSVLEHGVCTFVFVDVSRILTHEQVRHRAGMAYSQESLRYVRLDELRMYYPEVFKEPYLRILAQYALGRDKVTPRDHLDTSVEAEAEAAWAHEKAKALDEWFTRMVTQFEAGYSSVIELLGLDREGLPFEHKKLVTSALRRLAPSGMATNIMVTGNHRAWRHMIAQRTSVGAEEEIRKVFYDVAEILNNAFPSIYDDMLMHPQTLVCEFKHDKV